RWPPPGGRALPCSFPRLIAHLVHVGRCARASTWSVARCRRRRQLLQVIVIEAGADRHGAAGDRR
ncbi:hypothetical protein, partial [Pseudomonas sp. G(2018)]|uniref:hypothetical protein n=1 Tax=Pseudomonas sp. G(2018) TaxID=2502242 RepID=UPI001C49882B